MNRNLIKYETFFYFIRKRHFIKAQNFQRRNSKVIEEASKTREGQRYFSSLPMEVKAQYLVYNVVYKDQKNNVPPHLLRCDLIKEGHFSNIYLSLKMPLFVGTCF